MSDDHTPHIVLTPEGRFDHYCFADGQAECPVCHQTTEPSVPRPAPDGSPSECFCETDFGVNQDCPTHGVPHVGLSGLIAATIRDNLRVKGQPPRPDIVEHLTLKLVAALRAPAGEPPKYDDTNLLWQIGMIAMGDTIPAQSAEKRLKRIEALVEKAWAELPSTSEGRPHE